MVVLRTARFGEMTIRGLQQALQHAFPAGLPGSGLTSAERTPQRYVSGSYRAAVWAALPVYLYLDFKHVLLSAGWFEVHNFKC